LCSPFFIYAYIFVAMNKTLISLIALLLCFTACRKKNEGYTINRFEDPKQLEIAQLQDARDGKGLKKFINAKKEVHRYRAALAYASVLDTNAIPYLSLRVQTDRSARVRAAASYALGQSGHPKASLALIEGIGIEYEPWVRAVIIEALGKIPSKKHLDLILSLKSRDSLTDAGILAGLYQLTLRNVKNEAVYQKAMQSLDSGASNTHLYAANILARGNFKIEADSSSLPTWWDIFDHCQSLDAKIALATATGGFQFSDSNSTLLNAQQNAILSRITIERNHILRANLIRALARTGRINVGVGEEHLVHELIKEVHPQVLFAIREYLIPANKNLSNIWFEKEAFLKGSAEWHALKAFSIKHGTEREGQIERNNRLQHDFHEVKNSYQALPMIKTLAADPENFDFIFENTKNSNLAFIRSSGMQALNEITKMADCQCPEMRGRYALEVLPFALRSGDVGMISYACLAVIEDVPLDSSQHLVPILDSLTRTMKLPLEMETYIDVKRALAKLKGSTFKKPKPVYAHPINWDAIKQIQDTTVVVVKTNKGDITLNCYVNEAPGTVWNFLSLVDSGYYNGKSFHRLVPGFVIQGGCDRGDGWGSPAWSQRSEFSNFLKYKEGSVGIASVGSDTEGYQFFITHNATPHLTGRYTIFAEAVSGLKVMQSLDVGDRIVSISRQ
jgi:cyclophilin family peptidyl-prolyl cis-trans isomerase/HEAT repeat protein